MAVYNKAIFHAECVAARGEFLSLVWVLVAHMGCGERSDSAVTKKVEMQSDKELVVAMTDYHELSFGRKAIVQTVLMQLPMMRLQLHIKYTINLKRVT
ncbi:hypothetical protein SUGI_0934950 [Cryptomeria japonica]|nr:hypothetical protein SUGI_0934950 [Cryptomeria japonica]